MFPSASVSANILVVTPPRDFPMAWLGVPFCALTGAVDFDGRPINHRLFEVCASGQGCENAIESVYLYPFAEPLED